MGFLPSRRMAVLPVPRATKQRPGAIMLRVAMPAASVGARRSPGTATPMPSFMVLVCCAATVRKTKASERIRPLSVTHRCVKPSFSASVTYSISSSLAQVSPNSMLLLLPFRAI